MFTKSCTSRIQTIFTSTRPLYTHSLPSHSLLPYHHINTSSLHNAFQLGHLSTYRLPAASMTTSHVSTPQNKLPFHRSHRSIRRRPREDEQDDFVSPNKPDVDAYIKQQEHIDFLNSGQTSQQKNVDFASVQHYHPNLSNKHITPAHVDSQLGQTSGGSVGTGSSGSKAPRNFIQMIKSFARSRPFTRPIKLEDDIPMLVVKEAKKKNEKDQYQLFMPRSNHSWSKITDVPDIVSIARKDLYVAFLMYTITMIFLVTIRNLPSAIDLTKDAEKKHLALQQEVTKEEQYLSYLHNQMTPAEIYEAMEQLPRKPGDAWNPEEDQEIERMRKRLYYPA